MLYRVAKGSIQSVSLRRLQHHHDSNTIIKFADDTTVVGLIANNDETDYREEVRDLSVWCQDNNLSLNVSKTKEMILFHLYLNR